MGISTLVTQFLLGHEIVVLIGIFAGVFLTLVGLWMVLYMAVLSEAIK